MCKLKKFTGVLPLLAAVLALGLAASALSAQAGETTVITAQGGGYSVALSFDEYALLPEDTQLVVSEYDESSEIWQARYAEAAELYGWESGHDFSLLSISLMSGTDEIEPAAQVDVAISFSAGSSSQYTVTHFGEESTKSIACETSSDSGVQTITFSTGSLSDYAVSENTDYEIILASAQKLLSAAAGYGNNVKWNEEELAELCLEGYYSMCDLLDEAYSLESITETELQALETVYDEYMEYLLWAYGFDPYGASAAAIDYDEIVLRANQALGTDGLGWLSSSSDSGTITFDKDSTALWETGLGLSEYEWADEDSDGVNDYDTQAELPGESSETAGSIWYSVEYDSILAGNYREYHVYNANQLHALLYYYDSTNALFSTYLKESGGVNKLGIVFESDIDLGGAGSVAWTSFRNTSVYLDLDGNGYTVYNGYFPSNTNTFLGTGTSAADNLVAVHDLTFYAMYIGHANGMFGSSVNRVYFYNVNWENCLANEITSSSVAIVLGTNYTRVYMKDCYTQNCHVLGQSHSSLFASYDGDNVSRTSRLLGSGESASNYYYGNVPENAQYSYDGAALTSIEAVEAVWNGSSVTYEGETYTLNTYSPTIYENCGTLDCGLYVTAKSAGHNGGFVACLQGGMIFKNCFSTTDCYSSTQCGVFTGALIGSGVGFYYPDVCDDPDCDDSDLSSGEHASVLTNVVFENCWTSGSIEGSSKIGGFVGMIFDDYRAANSDYRGHALFKNCYSTSSVGMEYSGSYVGGFCGLIIGNMRGSTTDGAAELQHVFKNCYAAGEVGGITTDTDASSTANTIGGFIGMYLNVQAGFVYSSTYPPSADYLLGVVGEDDAPNNVARMINCCYDMQTTAMRERSIGSTDTTYWKNLSSKTPLANTLDGLSGVYTQASTQKNVAGLTDTENIMGSSGWTYYDEYYPMTTGTLNYTYTPTGNERIDAMYAERGQLYKYYSMVSAATVFLDHYDEILSDGSDLDANSNVIAAGTTGATADATIYDTVRDITRKFTFTSAEVDSEVTWETSTQRNEAYGFYDQLGDGFELTWQDDGEEISGSYNPNVLTIYQDGDTWKCADFAPGKQWVNVSIGVGTRYLRLLPSAYLNAGGIISVDVTVSDDDEQTVSNTVSMYVPNSNASGGWDAVTTSAFYHYIGVAYAITDRTRQDSETADIYENQLLTLADSDIQTDAVDQSSFAFYSGYLRTGDSTAVGLDDSGEMLEQTYLYEYSTSEVDSTRNLSTAGSTIVRVYYATDESGGEGVYDEETGGTMIELSLGDEITDSDTLSKFEGETQFEVADAGFYYMIYQWRLNDGRYLEDVKLVQITSEAYTVTMATGIKDNTHSVDSDGYTSIDQYVDITGKLTYDTADGSLYPSDETGYAASYESYYDDDSISVGYDYNETADFTSGSYGMKSITQVQTGNSTVAGWKNDDKYRLVSVILQANDGTGFTEVDRINVSDTGTDTFGTAVSGMIWKYTYTSYTATQDPEYKTYTIVRVDDAVKYLTVSGEADSGNGVTQYYINLDFSQTVNDSSDGSDGSSALSSGQKNIRVIALYEQVSTPVSLYKTDEHGNALSGAVFAAYSANESGEYLADGETDLYITLTDGDYTVDEATGVITITGGDRAGYTVTPKYVGTTDENGELIFADSSGVYYSESELQALFGDYFLLREISVPAGYRNAGDAVLLTFSGGILILADGSTDSADIEINARVTATGSLYTAADSGSSTDYAEVSYANDASAYYSINETSGEVEINGTLFAVVLKKNGATASSVDSWYPVDSQGNVTAQAGLAGAIAAAQAAGSDCVFAANSDIDAGFTGMEVYLTDLPGDITEYFTYQWNTAENPSVESVLESCEYIVAYYYTTADSLAGATTDNTVRVISHEGIVTADNSSSLADYSGFSIAWGAQLDVINYENRVYFQKTNVDGDKVNGAVFAIYSALQDGDSYYYIADDGTYIYLGEDEFGTNRGNATVNGETGSYSISAGKSFTLGEEGAVSADGYGVITVTVGSSTYTITPVQLSATHDCADVDSTNNSGTGHFTLLESGSYIMREIYAPNPYALNSAEIAVSVSVSAVSAAVLQGSRITVADAENFDNDEYSLIDVVAEVTDQYKVNITIDKISSNDESTLANAQFILYFKDGDAVYYYSYDAEKGIVIWTTDINEADILSTSDESGAYSAISIYNLTEGTYYLEEIAQPDGYYLLEEPLEITVDSSATVSITYNGNTYTADSVTDETLWGVSAGQSEDNDAVWTLTVPNYTGYELPGLGGRGTGAFTAAGIMLCAAAAVLFTKHKKRAE
ncbi:MAG: hypothetical protein LUH82_03200 [Clostridiales bacterium]|nr:hypothetical protein [Clostridiales bacterium]